MVKGGGDDGPMVVDSGTCFVGVVGREFGLFQILRVRWWVGWLVVGTWMVVLVVVPCAPHVV